MENQLQGPTVARTIAIARVNSRFRPGANAALDAFASKTKSFLVDYELIHDLLSQSMPKVEDYGFLVHPVFCAFESFVTKFLISHSCAVTKDMPIGQHLSEDGIPNVIRNLKAVAGALEQKHKVSIIIDEKKWIKHCQRMRDQWKENRIPFAHSELEVLESIGRVEIIHGSILRAIEIVAEDWNAVILNPILTAMKQQQEKK